MELIYLWIYNNKNIYNTGFNFSCEYNINYIEKTQRLEIIKTEKQKLDIFDDVFLNITAIIGKNGSGKTSLFLAIKELFQDNFYRLRLDYLYVLKDIDDRLYIYSQIKKIDVISHEKISYEILGSDFNLSDKVTLFNYSNSASIYEESVNNSRFLDLSLKSIRDDYNFSANKLFCKRFEQIQSSYIKKEIDEGYPEYIDEINLLCRHYDSFYWFYDFEIKSQIAFISKNQDEITDFGFIPELIEIKPNKLFLDLNQDYLCKNTILTDISIGLLYQILNKDVNNPSDNNEKRELFKQKIIIQLYLYLIRHDLFRYAENYDASKFISVFENLEEITKIPELLNDLILKLTPRYVQHEYSELNKFSEIHEFIKNLDTRIEALRFHSFHENVIYSNDGFYDFIKDLFEIWSDPEFIYVLDWVGLSGGQSALLSIFSRFSYVIGRSTEDVIWLLLDESELYLHPEWQRKLFSQLHKYLPLFFPKKKIQLFLTSHSPFFISDLPQDNVLLLDRVDGCCKVVDSNLNKTFGANIHALLSNSFFMNEGSIGDFAKKKINSLIEYLQSVDIYTEEWKLDSAWALINEIGDDFVKKHLVQMYNNKVGQTNNSEYIDEQIKRLQLLKEEQQGGNND